MNAREAMAKRKRTGIVVSVPEGLKKTEKEDEAMNLMLKNNIGLVEYCEAQLGRPYWWGTFGQKATQALYDMKRKQYPRMYASTDFPSQFGEKVHDCVGLIKGYFWCDGADSTSPKYCSNGMSDWSADTLYERCKKKSTVMATMPEVKGIAVFMRGHVGVYVGDGWVVEARGHAYGVVKTRLKDRKWQRWAYIHGLQYIV